MKMLKLTILSLGGSIGIIYGVCVLSDMILGRPYGILLAAPVGIAIGAKARTMAEKFLGYTTTEAMKDDQ